LRRSSTESTTSATSDKLDRGVVAVGDDEVAILVGLGRLVVGVDLVVEVVVLDRALGAVGVGGGERGADVLEADAVFEQRAGIELHPHRRQGAADDVDLADAVELRQPLLQHVGGDVVHLPRGAGGRGHRQHHDRRVGGVDLAIGRIGAQAGGRVGAGGVDRRLHVARRAVDVAVEAELQLNAGRAERTRRGHLVDVGDLPEMALERRGDRTRHRVGARARHARRHRDVGKVDLRQRRNRQLGEGEQPGERDADGQQRGGDRPTDEQLGEAVVHGASAGNGPTDEPAPRRWAMRSKNR
jgi:hypothetical protein